MNLKELSEKVSNTKGIIFGIAAILGISFGFHAWMTEYFVTKEHFDNSVTNIETKIDNEVTNKMNEQFLVLKRSIDSTEYNQLAVQIASINVSPYTDLTPLEITFIRQSVTKHCLLGKSLGLLEKSVSCEDRVDKKLGK